MTKKRMLEKVLAQFDAACLAYARAARPMRAGECDRHAMVEAIQTVARGVVAER